MGIVHTITEGGQIWTHRVRMLKQVLKIAITISCLVWFLIFTYFMATLPFILYQGAWYHLQAKFLQRVQVDKETWKRLTYEILSDSSVASNKVQRHTERYFNQLILIGGNYLKKSASTTFVVFLGIIFFFFIRGNLSKQRKHVSGQKISPVWWIALKLKLQGKASSIHISHLPLVKGTETQHILVTGGTGSGKTNCFHHILPQIRRQCQKVVIVDTNGAFIERYFRPGKDIILNPFDARSASWHPWIECLDKFDYDALAESFIPQSYSEHENYWRIAARSLLSSILIKLDYSRQTADLSRWLLFEPLNKLSDFLQGTKAAAHIDMNSEKTAGSVRSVCSSFLGCLEFIQDTNDPFSIRNWIQNEDSDSWLFLACKPSQRTVLNPLLSCWFSIATRSLLHMKPDLNRRLWFIIDELPSLHKLKDLETFLAESRKYGGCALLALQSPSQLEFIYGCDITKTILGNCATKIVFAEQDPEIAERISKIFGDREIKEYQEGLSYGANDVRDGVNLSLQTKNLPLVTATDIQFLEKNQAFVKLSGNISISKLKLKIIQ